MTMHDYRSPAEIEREIEEERRGLSGTLHELQDRFSFDRLSTEAGDYAREYGGDFGRSVARTVRDNPLAVALAGAGIAWMIIGSRRNGDSRDQYEEGAYGGYADYGGSTVGRPAYPYRAATEDRYEGGYYDERFEDVVRDEDPTWAHSYADVLGTPDESESMADRARDRYSEANERARGAADRARDAASRTRAGAESRLERARARLNLMRERLSHGTEDLPEDARARVVAARERAMEARHKAARQIAKQRRNAEALHNRQPLATGALAFAAGAAIAAALPRSRMEEDYIGDYSNRMMEEAERIFEEEREKAGRVAAATADEAKKVAREKTEEVRQGAKTAQAEAKEGAQRVAERARDEAKKEKLGKPGE